MKYENWPEIWRKNYVYKNKKSKLLKSRFTVFRCLAVVKKFEINYSRWNFL